jgi:hypothetical protein
VSTEYAVLSAVTEREAVTQIRTKKFTGTWWDEHLILEVDDLGELWFNETKWSNK